ncbi:glutaredoxin family protein [uncultured Thermanaerothrix sp.]|uniref:glutaredoxin family protein n=1 Tax=uncultured Thermanaerothrix sp. TaxID=1195149 RepID=UPI0026220145|nr:glutaredoxin family protein [uncultured Thermanaerothrix sp.]
MSIPIILYGATDCDDTAHTCAALQARGIAYTAINIATDPAAEAFVRFINRGYRSTPTLVIGSGKRKVILTEPTPSDLDWALSLATALHE